MSSTMKDWALWYVQAHGLAVFPLPPNKKAPGHLGIKSATRDLAQIGQWWDAEPTSNIGVLGCLRIDIDPKKGGDVNWAAIVAHYGDPQTLRVRTPSGGQHYYFHAPANVGNSPGLLPKGIDVRGADAGYTVAPPSITVEIPNKQCAGRYDILDAMVPIAPCPQWLLDMLTGKEQQIDAGEPEPLRADVSDDQLADLRSALMSPEMLSDWEKWSDTGYALLGLGDTGRELFFEYSAAQRELMPDKAVYETEEVWWRGHKNLTPRSDYRSVFSRAQSLGWKNPKSLDASRLGFGGPLPSGVVAAPSPIRKFEVKNGWEFANAPGIRWRIDKILPQEGVAVIYGPPAVGKSFVIIDLLMAIVRGIPYGHDQYPVEQGACMYVLAEGAAGVKQRLRAYQQDSLLAPESPAVHVISEAPNLFDVSDTQALIDAIVPTNAKVVVVDTLHASMMGGDENSAKDMGVVLGNCRKMAAAIGGLVILVHHVGKDAERGERGSSSIRGAMETMLELTCEDDGIRTVKISKQKDGDSNISWQFKLESKIVAGPSGVEESAIVRHVPTQVVAEKKTTDRVMTSEDAIVGLLAAQSGMQSEEGVSLEVVIANLLSLRPDLTHSKVNNTISKLVNSGMLKYINGDFLRAEV
jgi:hypothetical protein